MSCNKYVSITYIEYRQQNYPDLHPDVSIITLYLYESIKISARGVCVIDPDRRSRFTR